MIEEEISVTPSIGNVFADLDLGDPEELLAKAELVRRGLVCSRTAQTT